METQLNSLLRQGAILTFTFRKERISTMGGNDEDLWTLCCELRKDGNVLYVSNTICGSPAHCTLRQALLNPENFQRELARVEEDMEERYGRKEQT